MRYLGLLLMFGGCGSDGGDGGEVARTPESYLPEGVALDGLTEAQELCLLHSAVGHARMAECDPLGPENWGVTPPDWLDVSMEVCTRSDVQMTVYLPPSQAEHVSRCLDYRASAPCELLYVVEPDPTYAHCELVSPSW